MEQASAQFDATIDALAAERLAGQREERERCVKIAESACPVMPDPSWDACAEEIAEKIRGRE